jgi:hypothetical protein
MFTSEAEGAIREAGQTSVIGMRLLPLIVPLAIWLRFHSSSPIGIIVATVLLVVILPVGSERR